MYGFNVAALDALPYGLPRNAQLAHGLIHGEIPFGRLFCDARTQIISDANAPRSARGELFSSDDAVVEPAMNGRSSDSEYLRCLFDIKQLTFGWRGRRLVASDVPIATQAADNVGGEAMTVGRGALLTIENAGDDGVGIVDRETAHQRHRVFVGAHRRNAATRQVEIDLVKSATAPPQCEVCTTFILVDSNDNFFEQGS